jgi:predicted RNA-binding Zn-ribbon protein involved in translation (DUF1610 family)
MEEGKKKMMMIVVIVACLVAAGIITYSTRSRNTGGIESIKRGTEMYWLKCRNPDCEHEWQMDKRDYFEYLNEHREDAPPMSVPAIVCPKCGEDSGYRAEKCEKCGLVFERGSVPNDLPDRCPKCGYSAIEEARKKARSERTNK